MIFLPSFLDIIRMSAFIVSPRSSKLNSLPTKCFPLIYDLNGSKFRVHKHLGLIQAIFDISKLILAHKLGFPISIVVVGGGLSPPIQGTRCRRSGE